jgi:UPF0755 protein
VKGRGARAGRGAAAEGADAPGRPDAAAAPGGAGGERPRRSLRPVATLALLLLLAAGALAAYAAWALAPVDPADARVVEFEVPRGRSAAGVADDLVAAGLTRDARVARAYLIATGADTRIGEGLYDLRRDQGFPALRDALVEGGRPRTARLLLPEGLRLEGVVARVAAAGWSEAVAADLAALLAEPPEALRPEGLPEDATLEGYLFPATYDLPVRQDAAGIARALVDRFERELSDVVRAELVALDLSVHDWVTLASMVQAEAGGDDEMAIIAGVFLNRLDIGMALQSDPTVAYGLGKALPELDFPGGDFGVDHAWNTYTRAGLPTGPIGNPGAAALAAVLTPERHDAEGRPWMYFLHGRDGTFHPNLDYERHLQAVERHLR